MLNLTNKKYDLSCSETDNSVLKFSDIEKFYKKTDAFQMRIGLEYERLSLDKKTLKNASYEKMEKIITQFAQKLNWEIIYDDGVIIGAKNNEGTSISLEPGCQLELSLSPQREILLIELESAKLIKLLDEIADSNGIFFLGYGISPVSFADEIKLLDKRRYKVMNSYLPNCPYGELIPKMMRQTAGIQVNIDYTDSKDAYLKMKFFNLIMPFMSALFANSPFENGIMTNKKSSRAHVWRYCGKNRCNIFYKKIFSNLFPIKNFFKNYINEILNVPMIFIERENQIIEIQGKLTFREFMKKGYLGHFAKLDDYILHQSLCFPDVRLKQYIEIRNHDSSDIKMALSLCAFYKGLSLCNLKELLSILNFLKISDIDYYNEKVKLLRELFKSRKA